MDNLLILKIQLHSLVVFRNLLDNPVIKRLSQLLSKDIDTDERVDKYAQFVSELFIETDNLTDYILACVLEDENSYIAKKAQHIKQSSTDKKRCRQ